MLKLFKSLIFLTILGIAFPNCAAQLKNGQKVQNVVDFCRMNADNEHCQAIEQTLNYFKNKQEAKLNPNMLDLANRNLYDRACYLGRQLNWDSARVIEETQILHNELKILLLLNEKRQQKIKLTREELLNSASF